MLFLSTLAILCFVVSVRAGIADDYLGNLRPVIGIDFGDSYTRIAVKINGTVRVLTDSDGERSIPSYVALTDEGVLVGKDAKDYLKVRPDQVISDFRKLLGKTFEEIEDELGSIPYEVFDKGGAPMIRVPINQIDGKSEFSIDEVASKFLEGVKSFTEKALEQEVKNTVMAVPAYFDDKQKGTIRAVAEIAGLNILKFPDESSTAALAYGFGLANDDDDDDDDEQYVMVLDIGGWNHDVTILAVEEDLRLTVGTAHGRGSVGASFTTAVMGHLLEQNDEEEFFRLYEDPRNFIQYEAELERVKHSLFYQVSDQVEVDIPGLKGTISSSQLEESIMSRFNPTGLIQEALKEAELKQEDISDIILVGGSSRIPVIRAAAEDFFGKAPVFSYTVDPAEAVSIGAALYGHLLTEEVDSPFLTDAHVVTMGVGVKTIENEGALLVKDWRTTPTSQSQIFTTVHEDQREVIIQLCRYTVETPLSLNGGKSTKSDEHEIRNEDGVIGILRLSELPAARPGTTQVKVTIDIDTDLRLRTEAIHVESGKSASLTLENPPRNVHAFQFIRKADIPKGGEVTLLKVPVRHDEL